MASVPARSRYIGILALTCALVACGETPGTTVDGGGRIAVTPSQTSAPQPDSSTFVRQVLGQVAQAHAGIRTLEFDMTALYVSDDYRTNESNRMHIRYEAPSKMRLGIVASSKAGSEGTQLVWLGGGQVTIKTKFVGFWVTTDLAVDDDRLKDCRGDTIAQTGITPTLDTLLDPGNSVKFLGLGQLDGSQVAQLDVVSPRRLRGVAHAVYTIDAVNKLPVLQEMYDARDHLVLRVQMTNVQVNSTLSKDSFAL